MTARPLLLPVAAVVGVTLGVRLAVLATNTWLAWLAVIVATVLIGVVAAALRRWSFVVLAVVAALASLSGHHAWLAYHDVHVGEVDGWARVMSDPVVRGTRSAAVNVVLEVDGERFEVWARGSPGRRLQRVLAGDAVEVVGERNVPDDRPSYLRARHVVGRLDVERVGSTRPGPPAYEAANRVRRQVDSGARTMLPDDRALFTGLVMGDDRALSAESTAAFRSSGLSHLTAVSGQNVALLLAVASPLLRRLSPWLRWAATLALIAWFALLTRFEPSVLRASAMAAIGATAFVTGRDRSGVGVLSVALTSLLVLDPMLVWSVGFWLSASATAGLVLLSIPLIRALPGPTWWCTTIGSTLAAQLGVFPIASAVFGVPSVVGLAANVLAVPVAGGVMVVGFPCAIAASFLPDGVATAVMLPCQVGVRWVAGVARVMAGAAPPTAVNVGLWLAVLAAVGVAVTRHRLQSAAIEPE